MIHLTPEQHRELTAETVVIDPVTNETYILVRKETYERMKELLYDDSPWTDEEMDHLAEEAGEMLDAFRADQ